MPDNTVTLVGNLTRDPELRFTNSGLAQATLGIAVNRRRQNQSGDWEEQTSFFNIVCWRDLAENASTSLQKGARVLVTGRLEQRSWETQAGERRSVVEVIADDIAPSLRWATVEIRKNQRRTADDSDGGDGGDGGRAVGNEPQTTREYSNEEPF